MNHPEPGGCSRLWGTMDRYFFRQHLAWFSGCTGVVMAVCLIVEFSEFLRRYASDAATSTPFLVMLSLMKLPDLFLRLMPFLGLFANMLCFRTLKESRQLLVVQGSGVPLLRMLRPFLVSTLLLGVLGVALLNPVATWCSVRVRQLTDPGNAFCVIPSSGNGLWVVQEGVQGVRNREVTRMIRMGQCNPEATRVEQVSVFEFDASGDGASLIRFEAGEGHLAEDHAVLGTVQEIAGSDQPVFHHTMRIEGFVSPSTLLGITRDTDAVPLWRVPRMIRDLETLGLDVWRFQVYAHGLFVRIALMAGLVLLSSVFVMRAPQRSRGRMLFLAGALVAFCFYLAGDILHSMTLSRRTGLWALWLLPLVCALVAGLAITVEKRSVTLPGEESR